MHLPAVFAGGGYLTQQLVFFILRVKPHEFALSIPTDNAIGKSIGRHAQGGEPASPIADRREKIFSPACGGIYPVERSIPTAGVKFPGKVKQAFNP
jgi:uncharacterized protein YbaR (Trm112 family)